MSANGHMTPGEAEAYNLGLLDGSDAQYYTDRIAAFGAIRRAVMEAREWEKAAKETYLDISHGGSGWVEMEDVACAIRCAIRAAIGSPKA